LNGQSFHTRLLIGFAVFFMTVLPEWAMAAEKLPAFAADPGQTTMSGFSSGAFLTAQFGVAYSASLAGVGIVAGGPFDCAEGAVQFAWFRCMKTTIGAPPAQHLVEIAKQAQQAGRIDDLANLATQRVFIVGSRKDPVVTPPVIESLASFYHLAGVPDGNVTVTMRSDSGHAFLTQDFGSVCDATASPFINACGIDMAGQILTALYGRLNAPSAEILGGRTLTFDQSEFLPSPRGHGLDDQGFLYVPRMCENAVGKCRLHVALHGCMQGRESIGDLYYTRTGYNRWADANGILILYPQAVRTLLNLQGCWDWFGYDGPDYYTKSGHQMAAIKAMIDRVLEGANR